MNDLVERYIASWNESDPHARRSLLTELWTQDGTYTDPLADVRGPEQVDSVIAAAQEQFPGMRFTLISPVDAHHQQARFSWGLGPDGSEPLVEGFDVAVTDADGRLASVLGFLDKVPG